MTKIGLMVLEILYLKVKNIIKNLRLFYIFFPHKSEFKPKKTNNYELKCVTFYPEAELYDAVFFFSYQNSCST